MPSNSINANPYDSPTPRDATGATVQSGLVPEQALTVCQTDVLRHKHNVHQVRCRSLITARPSDSHFENHYHTRALTAVYPRWSSQLDW